MAHINLQKIISVKGQAGLFHLVNYNPKGYFLQPFEGGPSRFLSNEKGRVLAIGNVDLKLEEGSINSLDIFLKMKDQKTPSLDATNEEVGVFFNQLIANLDSSVVSSHLKKILGWYYIINKHYTDEKIVNEEDDGLTII